MNSNLILMSLAMVNAPVAPPPSIPSKFVQEAEIKHGRVAMVSSVAIPILDNLDPDTLGINVVNSMPIPMQLSLFGIFGCSEVAQMFKAYNFPNEVSDWFTLKDTHVPGDYNFDPLNISKGKNIKKNELTVGRMAMLAAACEIGFELTTGEKVLTFA